jgi:3-hydroxyacyl-[acyl-carrier-protein] dehydratase
MPPALLFDISTLDLKAEPLFDQKAICQINPQQYEMQHLDGILWLDEEKHLVLGYKDVTDHEFWIRGHIPGRPLMPGVIMLEAAAQVLSFYVKQVLAEPGFVGFGGISDAKFRSTVVPGDRLYLLAHAILLKKRKKTFKVQGIVDGRMVFEATIEGLRI